MKGLAGSAGPMAVVVLGLVTGGAVGKSLLQDPSEHRLDGVDTAASPSKDTLKGSLSRNLQGVTDDALDPNGTVSVNPTSQVACFFPVLLSFLGVGLQ